MQELIHCKKCNGEKEFYYVDETVVSVRPCYCLPSEKTKKKLMDEAIKKLKQGYKNEANLKSPSRISDKT
jgi:hypothetical protein